MTDEPVATPPAHWRLQLRDSELARAESPAAGRCVLHLSAAWLSDGSSSGLAPGVSLWLDGVQEAGPLADLLGTVRDGHWLDAQGRRQPWLPVGPRLAGPLRLVLQLGHQVEWQATALALQVHAPASPQLRPWLTC
jgi:hypothetical protein